MLCCLNLWCIGIIFLRRCFYVYRLFICVLICGVLALSSCVREEDYPEKIVGDWALTEWGYNLSHEEDDDTTIYISDEYQGSLRIQMDGTKIRSFYEGNLEDEEEYYIVGDQLSLGTSFDPHILTGVYHNWRNFPEELDGPFTIESLTNNKLVLREIASGWDTHYYKFKRF